MSPRIMFLSRYSCLVFICIRKMWLGLLCAWTAVRIQMWGNLISRPLLEKRHDNSNRIIRKVHDPPRQAYLLSFLLSTSDLIMSYAGANSATQLVKLAPSMGQYCTKSKHRTTRDFQFLQAGHGSWLLSSRLASPSFSVSVEWLWTMNHNACLEIFIAHKERYYQGSVVLLQVLEIVETKKGRMLLLDEPYLTFSEHQTS